ncbi:UvrD-helicase domain-containing protein [Halocola ammonii]
MKQPQTASGNFVVYRSSAGSGKTFTLVVEFLKLALSTNRSDRYRSILAITFTNKAAAEMRSRIVENLRGFAAGPGHPDYDKNMAQMLLDHLQMDEETLKERAGNTLKHILHNFSDLNVSTIDRFVHRLIRSFSRDLDLPMDFEVSTDTEEVVQTAIDNLLEKAGSDKELTSLLVEFVKSKVDDEKEWNINNDLKEAGMQIFREDSSHHIAKLREMKPADFLAVKDQLIERKKKYENAVAGLAKRGLDLIDEAGIDHNHFFQKGGAVPSFFKKSLGEVTAPNSYVRKAIEEDKWFAGNTTAEAKSAIESIIPELTPLLEELIDLTTGAKIQVYHLTAAILKNIYSSAVIHEIEAEINRVEEERNLVLVSDFHRLVSEVVVNNPAPFIYERIGEKFTNYLIDEFQDTSVLQWQNFLPLFQNALSRDQFTMLVGDGKQAIYRWRNGDVEQFIDLPNLKSVGENTLISEYQQSLERNYRGEELEFNFRSKAEVVQFNNEFYRALAGQNPSVAPIYETLAQKEVKGEGGYVRIEKLEGAEDKDDLKEKNIERVMSTIENCLADGFSQQDIAVITRSNKDAVRIASDLLSADKGYRVISAESLLLENDREVQLIMSYITWLFNPEDRVAQVKLAEKVVVWKFGHRDHSELTRLLKKDGLHFDQFRTLGVDLLEDKKQRLSLTPYELIESVVRLFSLSSRPNAFVEFLLESAFSFGLKRDNSVHSFLEWWEEKGRFKSIQTTEGTDAINIMTIHKSKGLQFPVVIFPFANFYSKADNEFWVDLENEALPSARVSLSEKRPTPFDLLRQQEADRTLLDIINMFYVATTRPQSRLYMLYGAGNKPNQTFKLIEAGLNAAFENSELVEIGTPQPAPKTEGEGSSESNEIELNQFGAFDYRKKLRISLQAPFHWEVEAPQKDREYGNLLHQVMSFVYSSADLETALQKVEEEGWLRAGDRQTVRAAIEEVLTNSETAKWYSEGWEVFNEVELLTAKGDVLRPDRIQYNESGCVVIDYKTGSQLDSHLKQMRNYVREVESVLGRKSEGYLIYFEPWAVVKI